MTGPKRVTLFVVVIAVGALLVFLFGGCALTGKGRIKGDGVTVQGAKDANGVSLAQGAKGEVLPLPAGSKLVIARTEAMTALPATPTTPAQPAQPAKEVVEVVVSRDTVWRRDETKIAANTGVIDQTVALRRIDLDSAKPLLFASIGAAVLAAVFFYIKYPTPALIFGGVSLIFFMAWKVSGLPPWFWILGVFGAGAGIFLWFGHRRGESDGVKAAVSGNIESQPPKVVS